MEPSFSKAFNKILFEMYDGNRPSVKHLKPFGALAYVGIPKPRRQGKLGAKSKAWYFS